MNLINSCQAITHSLLVNQPYSWYFLIVAGLIFLKIISTLFKTHSLPHPFSTRLPRKASRIFNHYHFPLNRVQVLVTNQSLAFTSGFLSPKISLSQGLIRQLTSKQLEAVILHELYHARHYHPLQVALTKVIASILALLPVIDDLAHYYWLLLETQADAFALSQQHSTRYLRGALAKMLVSPLPDYVIGFAYPAFDQRVHCLLTNRQPLPTIKPLKGFISALVLLSLFWYSQQWQRAQALEDEYHVSSQCNFAQCVSNCVAETLTSPAPLLSPDIRYSMAD